MGHSISLYTAKTFKKQIKNCFPIAGEGNYKADLIDGILVPSLLQDSISITYNLSDMYTLALKNIDHIVDDFGKYLHGARTKDALPMFEKMFDELISHPEIYKPLEPDNGWGTYKGLCDKIYALIFACRKYPKARIYDWY